MQTIDITSLSGHSPYNISICDISYSNCSVVATGVVSAPVTVTVPTLLQISTQLIVSITDSIGCEYFEVISCVTPTPTPTITNTPTITPTNISCSCITFVNDNPASYGYGYTDCDGFTYTYKLGPYTTVYVCGKDPDVFGSPITYSIGSPCVENTCPFPSPTPSGTPTPTPTLPPIVGYFVDCCNPANEFMVSDIPISFSPLSGTYFINTDKFIGCATSIVSTSSNVIYSYTSMSTSILTCDDCIKINPFYACANPTPTQTQTPTQTPTPTNTPTLTPTLTPTPTNGLSCSSSVVPPTTISGITITESYTGSVSTYGPTTTSCGITVPANSKWLGLSGAFSYTMNFSIPINNLIVFIAGTGQNGLPNQENFIFTTNTGSGIPTITSTDSCYSSIVGNEVFSGGAPIGGGGGKFKITNSVNYTSVTISGNGGYLGSNLSICSNSF